MTLTNYKVEIMDRFVVEINSTSIYIMNNLKSKRLLWFHSILLCHFMLAQGIGNAQDFPALYGRWHAALNARRWLSEPMWFSTNAPGDVGDVNKEIETNQMGMAGYMCAKIADSQEDVSYQDALLLDRVAGISLLLDNSQPFVDQNIQSNLVKFTAAFREAWHQGIYKEPSGKVGELCNDELVHEGKAKIDPGSLQAIRRYGIFGIPELIRQIKMRNSSVAFAVYLLISHQNSIYSEYIDHSDVQFTTVDAKLANIRAKLTEWDKNGGGSSDIMRKASVALGD